MSAKAACVSCGSTRVAYRNYRKQPFCWPCADGQAWPVDPVTHPAPLDGYSGLAAQAMRNATAAVVMRDCLAELLVEMEAEVASTRERLEAFLTVAQQPVSTP